MYCTNCGKQNDGNMKFCTNCGKALQPLPNNAINYSQAAPSGNAINYSQTIPSNEGLVVTSSEPLPNKLQKFKKLYWIFIICMALGVVSNVLFAIGLMGILIFYCLDDVATKIIRNNLRAMVFRLVKNTNYDEMFPAIQPALISKYGLLLERDSKGGITISHNNYIYDIHLYDNGTFTIWWRMSLGKAFLSVREYRDYKQILADMGIIVYEIQQAYNIHAYN